MSPVVTPQRMSLREILAGARRFGIGDLITRGAVAGAVAGLVFILANMIYANATGKPEVAPFLDISTIFHFADQPEAATLMQANEVIIGLIVHFSLAVLFGIVFAFLVPLMANAATLTVAALLYGGLLYVVNFQVFGRILFDWFQDDRGPNQVFELIIHPFGYGLILVPFFLGVLPRIVAPPAGARPGAQAE